MRHSFHRARIVLLSSVSAIALGAACLGVSGSSEPPGAAEASYECTSRPSEVRELGFATRGTVGKMLVKVGDSVHVGQEIARLEDSVQRATVDLAEIGMKDTAQLDQATSTLAFREKEVAEIELAGQRSAATGASEVREAKYRRDVAAIELASAKTKARTDAVLFEREKSRLNEMRIASPIDGSVVLINKNQGEGVIEGNPVVTVIRTDPLWVDLFVPIRISTGLKLGQRAMVTWEDIDGVREMPGSVIFISPAADGGARQLQVRVEVPNSEKIPAGLHGKLRFATSP